MTHKTVVRVTCDTGNSWVTRINTTFGEARRYFMGQQFTREDGAGHETVDTVVRVEDAVADGCPRKLCQRTLAVYKPGVALDGVVCSGRWNGRVPCTGRYVCHLCGKDIHP